MARTGDGVRVFSIDREAVTDQVRLAVERLALSHPEIQRVILFGSLVRDDYGPASDADLALILSHSDKPMRERIPDYLVLNIRICVDVFPYTQAEFDARLAEGDPFVRRILAEGKVLFKQSK